MVTKRNALLTGILFIVLFTSACGGAPAATQAPPHTEAPFTDYIPEEAATKAPAATEAPVTGYIPDQSTSSSHPPLTPSNREPYDMFFEDYGVNPSIDTEDDNLSTFALDVDTGSYTIMRNYLSEGNLPPSESVSVEEYINYFDQGYHSPPAHQAFGIYLDGAPSPFTQSERYQMLRVGIQGYQVPVEERKDASLTFVIDVSGSMDMDNRLGLVKRSLELLVEQLTTARYVSALLFMDRMPASSWSRPLVPIKGQFSKRFTACVPRARPMPKQVYRLGYQMAMHTYNPEGINRVILCSDGVANVGVTGPDAILEEVSHSVEEGVTLTTIGFGMDNYNDVLMEQLADNGDGFYAYVDDHARGTPSLY